MLKASKDKGNAALLPNKGAYHRQRGHTPHTPVNLGEEGSFPDGGAGPALREGSSISYATCVTQTDRSASWSSAA